MAAHNSTQYGYQTIGANGRTLAQGPHVGGKVRCFYADFTTDSTDSGDTINMVTIPKGYAILPGSVIIAEALGTSVTLAVGDGTTAAKYAAATAMNTDNKELPLVGYDELGVELTADTVITLTVAGANCTDAKGIKAFIYAQQKMD